MLVRIDVLPQALVLRLRPDAPTRDFKARESRCRRFAIVAHVAGRALLHRAGAPRMPPPTAEAARHAPPVHGRAGDAAGARSARTRASPAALDAHRHHAHRGAGARARRLRSAKPTPSRWSQALRVDRSVLWAEPIADRPSPSAAAKPSRAQAPGRSLLVRFKDDATPMTGRRSLATLAERDRHAGHGRAQIGNIWVLGVADPQSRDSSSPNSAKRSSRTPTSSMPIRCAARIRTRAERSVVSAAMVAARPARGHQRRDGVGRATERGQRHGRGRRHRHPSTIRISPAACCPATISSPTPDRRATATPATRIRATKATGATANAVGYSASRASSTACSSPD